MAALPLSSQQSLLLAAALLALYLLLSSNLSALAPIQPLSSSPPIIGHHFSLHSSPNPLSPPSPSPSSLPTPLSPLSSPSPPLTPPPHLSHVDVYSLFPPSSHPLSSSGELLYISSPPPSSSSSSSPDYVSYPLCSFTHVCLTPSSLLFRFPNASEHAQAQLLLDECAPGHPRPPNSRHHFDLCQCFYPPELSPQLLPLDQLQEDAATANSANPPFAAHTSQSQRAGRPLRRDSGPVLSPADGAVSNQELLASLPSSPSYYAAEPTVGVAIPGSSPPILTGHYWSVHKYVARMHHIGHWAQRVVLLSSLFQHSQALPLPPLDGIVVQDTESPLSAHEEGMLNLSLLSLLTQQDHPLLARYLGATTAEHSPPPPALAYLNQVLPYERLTGSPTGSPAPPTPYTCVERVSFVKSFGIFSTNNHDTMAMRATAYARYGIDTLSHRCPPRRITLLTRANRRILNQQQLLDWLTATFHKEVHVVEISSQSTPREQVEVFARSGLLLASHSSQLVNVLFSHPRSAMVEVAPEYYNSDFSEYAHGMGVHFTYALGGSVPGAAISDSMRQCMQLLDECEGDSYCILLKRFERACKERVVCCKYMDGFEADMDKIKMAVQRAVNHLNWACGEEW